MTVSHRFLSRWLLLALLLVAPGVSLHGQALGEPQVVSPLGAKYYALPDEKGAVAEAEKKLVADPKNVELILALGQAQGGVWRMRDAVATYTRGLELAPDNAKLYVARGHRYISTRQFDKALADLERAAALDPKAEGLWYHLGLAHYLRGEFDQAAAAFQKSRDAAKDDNALVGPSDWLYMSLWRAGKAEEAAKVLERITPEMKLGEHENFYHARLLLYKGLKKESELTSADPPTDVEGELKAATLGYGVGNWHLYNGHADRAREYFRRIVAGKAWAAFAFIAAEVELERAQGAPRR